MLVHCVKLNFDVLKYYQAGSQHILGTFLVSTLFETENDWQKTEPVPISLPRASKNFPDGEIFLS